MKHLQTFENFTGSTISGSDTILGGGIISDFKSLYHDYWIVYHNRVKNIEKIISCMEDSYVKSALEEEIKQLRGEITQTELYYTI